MAKSSQINRLKSNKDRIKKEKNNNIYCLLKKEAKYSQLHLEIKVIYYPSLLN